MGQITMEDLSISDASFGLLLGAGASYEAGFPLMTDLTKAVIDNLSDSQVQLIIELLNEDYDGSIDLTKGIPNIEVVADRISIRAIKSGETGNGKYLDIISDIRGAIVSIITSISNPNLNYHINMLQAFKRIRESVSAPLWIFTTNYDPLIELAAAEVGVPVNDGFLGAGPLRFLDSRSLTSVSGSINGSHFEHRKGLQINLVKLHGSIDWWSTKDGVHVPKVYSTVDQTRLRHPVVRTIIFPQKSKVYETMDFPYDQFWRVASGTLGQGCKFLTTIGYSFGDEHINRTLLIPYLFNRKIKVSALLGFEPTNFEQLTEYAAFNFTSGSRTRLRGKISTEISDIWKFSSFVRELCTYAGI